MRAPTTPLVPPYHPQAAPLRGYGDIKIGTFVCDSLFYTELVVHVLTPLKTNEHTPLLYQSPFPLCYIGVVCFLLPELGAFFQRSQLNLASFFAQQ